MKHYMTNNIRKKFAALIAVVSLSLLPAVAFAQNNGGNKGTKMKEVRSSTSSYMMMGTSTVPCPTSAFGHLVAPGKVKRDGMNMDDNMHYGMIVVPEGCVLPPGIAKKVHMMTGTSTTTDTTAPTLSGITFLPATSAATFDWNTNEAADSAVFYSTAFPVDLNAASTHVVSSGVMGTSHTLTISGLETGVTYYAVLRSRDAAGNVALSTPLSFTSNEGTE